MRPSQPYGTWTELGYLEVGKRVEDTYDEASSVEHRLCRAAGLTYGRPPRHWSWEREIKDQARTR